MKNHACRCWSLGAGQSFLLALWLGLSPLAMAQTKEIPAALDALKTQVTTLSDSVSSLKAANSGISDNVNQVRKDITGKLTDLENSIKSLSNVVKNAAAPMQEAELQRLTQNIVAQVSALVGTTMATNTPGGAKESGQLVNLTTNLIQAYEETRKNARTVFNEEVGYNRREMSNLVDRVVRSGLNGGASVDLSGVQASLAVLQAQQKTQRLLTIGALVGMVICCVVLLVWTQSAMVKRSMFNEALNRLLSSFKEQLDPIGGQVSAMKSLTEENKKTGEELKKSQAGLGKNAEAFATQATALKEDYARVLERQTQKASEEMERLGNQLSAALEEMKKETLRAHTLMVQKTQESAEDLRKRSEEVLNNQRSLVREHFDHQSSLLEEKLGQTRIEALSQQATLVGADVTTLQTKLESMVRHLDELQERLGQFTDKLKRQDATLHGAIWPPPFLEGQPLFETRQGLEQKLKENDAAAADLLAGLTTLTQLFRQQAPNPIKVGEALHALSISAYAFWRAHDLDAITATREWREAFQKILDERGLPLDIETVYANGPFDMTRMLCAPGSSQNRIKVKETLSWVVYDKSGGERKILKHALVMTV